MRGHVARKGNRYYAVVYEGFDPATGKERHRWHAAGDTRKGGREGARRAGQADARRRLPRARPDHARRLPARAVATDQEGTASAVDVQLLPQQRRASTSCRASARSRCRSCSPRTSTRSTRSCCATGGATVPAAGSRRRRCGSSTASSARRSPTRTARAPSPATSPTSPTHRRSASADRRTMTVWSADELRDFLASIEDSEWYVPIFLAANTGMRRGEVLGLTWRNVDLDAARLVVSQQILSVEYEAERRRREDRAQPTHDRPRPADRRRAEGVAPSPARAEAAHRPARRRRVRVHPPRRRTDPPRLLLAVMGTADAHERAAAASASTTSATPTPRSC